MRSLAQSGVGSLRTLLPGLPVRAVGRQERRGRGGGGGAGVRRPRMSGSPLLLIGAGRMGGALLKGWIAGKAGPIVVVEPKPSPSLKTLARKKAITLAPA